MKAIVFEYITPCVHAQTLRDVLFAMDGGDATTGHNRVSNALDALVHRGRNVTDYDLQQLHFSFLVLSDLLNVETWHRQIVKCQVIQSKKNLDHHVIIVTGSLSDWKSVIRAQESDDKFNEQVQQIHSLLLAHGFEKYLRS